MHLGLAICKTPSLIIFKWNDYNVKDFDGMLATLEARLPNTFKKIISVSKSREITSVEIPAAPAVTPPPAENTPSPYAAQQPKPHKTSPVVITLRVAGAAVGGIGFIGGLVVNYTDVQNALNKYDAAQNPQQVKEAKEGIKSKITLRNTMYTIAGVGLCGFTVTLFF